MSMSGEEQYLALCHRIIQEGIWVYNKRTEKRTLTVINADLVYDVGAGEFPLITTRRSYYKAAIAEFLGYIKGFTNAADFRKLGAKTWDANANENEAWLNNPARTGEDDMGRVYGAQMRDWRTPEGHSIDQLKRVYNELIAGNDTRGLILQMWNPGEFHLGCLRPCVYEHQFSILDGTLYLNSTQRSCDVALGLNFNMVQLYFFLALMAQITNLKPGKVYHKIINVHLYEDQVSLMRDVQLEREPLPQPKFLINTNITNLYDVEYHANVNDFVVQDYEHHPAIIYPFSV